MDKLSLHESLRIYIPGLLLSITLYAMFKETLSDIANVAIPAIFLGFAINAPLHSLYNVYFHHLEVEHKIEIANKKRVFIDHQKNIISLKYLLLHPETANPFENIDIEKGWNFVMSSHFAKNYDSSETSSFRLPKSLGVMCFNLFIVSLSSPLIYFASVFFTYQKPSMWQLCIVETSLVFALLFFVSSSKFLKSSLQRELYYWASISNVELEAIAQMMKVQQLLSLNL